MVSYGHNIEGILAQWCNPLTLQPDQLGGQRLIPSMAPPLEHHDERSWTLLAPIYLALITATSPPPSFSFSKLNEMHKVGQHRQNLK